MTEQAGLVSVLMPAFNARATVAAAIRSAAASASADIEIIVVDDGSTDGTHEIAAAHAARDRRISVLRQAHFGVSAALNRGLEHCRGEFVARIDADDLWHPTKIDKQLRTMREKREPGLVYTFVRYVNEEGLIVRDAPVADMNGSALCQCLLNGIVGGGSSVMFRRSVLAQVGGWNADLRIWEDLLLHLRVAAIRSIAYVPEYLTAYRLREGSLSGNLRRSLADWRSLEGSIAAEFPQIPGTVRRWVHASRLLEQAEALALRRQAASSIALLAESFAYDPRRTGAYLVNRLSRYLSRRRARPRPFLAPFESADPTRSVAVPETKPRSGRLETIDESRQRFVRSFDNRIAAAASEAEQIE